LGRSIFSERFIPNFVELTKKMTKMLKKDNEIKWDDSAKDSFSTIKKYLGETPMLMSPNYK
jgi:hypothetical protein